MDVEGVVGGRQSVLLENITHKDAAVSLGLFAVFMVKQVSLPDLCSLMSATD